jgi:hypothetical protein
MKVYADTRRLADLPCRPHPSPHPQRPALHPSPASRGRRRRPRGARRRLHRLAPPGSDSLYDLVAFLSSLEVAFTIIEPRELRELLATLAARYQAAAREPDGLTAGFPPDCGGGVVGKVGDPLP